MSACALIVEDDLELAQAIRGQLEELGLIVQHTADGLEAVRLALSSDFRLVILDLALPGMHGIEVCKNIREKLSVPIIVLSANFEQAEKILSLELGADYFIAKPVSGRELKARVKAILNWNKPAAGIPPVIDCEHLQIDIQRRTVSCAGEPRKLSATEFDILLFLALHPNQAFSREQICSAVLGYDAASTYGSLTVLLNRIRAKIEPDPASPRFIRTVRGVGYCFASTTQDQDEE